MKSSKPRAHPLAFTTADVADLMNVNRRTVTRWAEEGRLGEVSTEFGQSLFAIADVARLMSEVNGTSAAVAASAATAYQESSRGYAHESAVASRAADVAADAVSEAGVLAGHAARNARLERAEAGRQADEVIARAATEDALATRHRAEAAATRVRGAAELAAAVERTQTHSEDPDALLRAAETASTVQAAAAAVAEETAALALTVADNVARTAGLVAATRLALDRAIEAEVAATAAAVELKSLAAAHLAAAHVEARLSLVANEFSQRDKRA